MRYYILLILSCIVIFSCGISDPTEPEVQWEDIFGAWISTNSYYPFTFDDNLKPLTYRPKSYYVFDYDRAEIYEEEWSNFSYITCSWEYFSTKVFSGRTIQIQEAGEYSSDEGKEVLNIYWSRFTREAVTNNWVEVYDYCFLMNYVLLSMSDNRDTLVIGYCDMYNCGGNQFMDGGYFDTDTLVRVNDSAFDQLKSHWWYY